MGKCQVIPDQKPEDSETSQAKESAPIKSSTLIGATIVDEPEENAQPLEQIKPVEVAEKLNEFTVAEDSGFSGSG